MAGQSAAASVGFAVAMCGLAIGAVWWRSDLAGSTVATIPTQPWEHVEERFPMPPEAPDVPSLGPEALRGLVEANPFSSTRRYVPPPDLVDSVPAPPPPPPEPVLRFKGRIQIGERERAILEDLTAGKTHFVEVGQTVVGYKVLDIKEEQVLLSDLQTNKEVAIFLTSE